MDLELRIKDLMAEKHHLLAILVEVEVALLKLVRLQQTLMLAMAVTELHQALLAQALFVLVVAVVVLNHHQAHLIVV
jgi:hypothetical protein